ncbi:hypothetical protein A5768_02520 [Mycolicibacterium fortuitum]|nr:hypothetical protein A5768_02520 [Mycolicibacterium fortuitum]
MGYCEDGFGETAEYRVGWASDIEAAGQQEAARQALVIQRDSGASATVFEVARLNRDEGGHPQLGQHRTIDLTD